MKEAIAAMRLIFIMAAACILAIAIGSALDKWLHTTPWCLLILLAYAIISSLYLIIKKLGDERE